MIVNRLNDEHCCSNKVTIEGKTNTAMVKLIIVISIRKTPISKNACVEAPIKTKPEKNEERAAKNTGIPTVDAITLKYIGNNLILIKID